MPRGEGSRGLKVTHQSHRRASAGSTDTAWCPGQQGLKNLQPKLWTESGAQEALQRGPVSAAGTNSGVWRGDWTRNAARGGPESSTGERRGGGSQQIQVNRSIANSLCGHSTTGCEAEGTECGHSTAGCEAEGTEWRLKGRQHISGESHLNSELSWPTPKAPQHSQLLPSQRRLGMTDDTKREREGHIWLSI